MKGDLIYPQTALTNSVPKTRGLTKLIRMGDKVFLSGSRVLDRLKIRPVDFSIYSF